jgi:hypothetical protein
MSALLTTLNLLGWSTATFAAPVYLTCPSDSMAPTDRMFLTIDYSKSTVLTWSSSDATPMSDVLGRTAEPAQVTGSQIAWQIVTRRADGLNYAEHFTLNRLTGLLSTYDDGVQNGQAWVCQVGAKPRPKF